MRTLLSPARSYVRFSREDNLLMGVLPRPIVRVTIFLRPGLRNNRRKKAIFVGSTRAKMNLAQRWHPQSLPSTHRPNRVERGLAANRRKNRLNKEHSILVPSCIAQSKLYCSGLRYFFISHSRIKSPKKQKAQNHVKT